MQYTPYEMLKYWLPLVSAFLLVIKGWLTGKKLVTGWAEKLLNNHLHHIEINTAETVNIMRVLREEQAKAFEELHDAMHNRAEMDTKIQQGILTNLEILKDR